jgi:hypothetical protein
LKIEWRFSIVIRQIPYCCPTHGDLLLSPRT